jgi:hypothetical protein
MLSLIIKLQTHHTLRFQHNPRLLNSPRLWSVPDSPYSLYLSLFQLLFLRLLLSLSVSISSIWLQSSLKKIEEKGRKNPLDHYLSITTVETSSNFLPLEGIYRMLLGEILLRAPFSLANPLSATKEEAGF